MPQIITDRPVYNTMEPEIIDSGYRRFGSRGSLVLFLIVILLIGWILATRNYGLGGIGVNGPGIFGWPGNKPTIAVDTGVGADRQVGSIEVPGITPERSTTVPITETREPVILPETPAVALPAPPAAPVYQDSEVTGYARTTADYVNLRRGPSLNYRVVLVLPRGWPVMVLRQTHIDNTGEV